MFTIIFAIQNHLDGMDISRNNVAWLALGEFLLFDAPVVLILFVMLNSLGK